MSMPDIMHSIPAEEYEGYVAGGFYPVELHQVILERFIIKRKLGYGKYATVWLAWDSGYTRYVAMKFLEAEASRSNNAESAAYRSLSQHHHDRQHSHFERIVTLYETIELPSPYRGDAKHLCLVFEPMGPTCLDILDEISRNETWLAKAVIKDGALGLEAMHSQGLAHGDFTLSNVLLSVPNLSSVLLGYPRENIDQQRGREGDESVTLRDANGEGVPCPAPSYLPRSRPLWDLVKSRAKEVKIADLGGFGPAPPHYQNRWRDEYFRRKRNPGRLDAGDSEDELDQHPPLEQEFQELTEGVLSFEERQDAWDLIRGCLKPRPEDRFSIKDVMKTKYLQRLSR
ncbi:MAG: hypothetical protein Q9162_004292 [Coniocarpon cinnabarinum]